MFTYKLNFSTGPSPSEAQKALDVLNDNLSDGSKHFIRDLCIFLTDIRKSQSIQNNPNVNREKIGILLDDWLTISKEDKFKFIWDLLKCMRTNLMKLFASKTKYNLYEYMSSQFGHIIEYTNGHHKDGKYIKVEKFIRAKV